MEALRPPSGPRVWTRPLPSTSVMNAPILESLGSNKANVPPLVEALSSTDGLSAASVKMAAPSPVDESRRRCGRNRSRR